MEKEKREGRENWKEIIEGKRDEGRQKEKRRGKQAGKRSKEARNQQGKNRDKNINPSVFKKHFWVILFHPFCKISKL